MGKIKNWITSNYIIIIILVIASIIRLYHLVYQSVWLDEIASITEANPSVNWSDLNVTIVTSDPHPQLYFIFLKTLFILFGYTIWVARFYSAVVGVLGVFSIYLLGKEMMNKNIGLISAFLLAINAFHLNYSQEVRMYALLCLVTVLSFYRLIIFLKNTTYKNAVWYGIFTGLMLITQFFGLFVLVSQLFILFIVLLRLDKKEKLQFLYKSIVSGIVSTAIFLPAVGIFIETTKKKYAAILPTTIDTIKQIFKDFADNSDAVLWISMLIIAFYFVVVIKKKLFKNKEESLVILILLSWILVTLIVPIIRSYLVTPMINSRYFIVILPPIIVLVALGIDKMGKKAIQLGIIAALAVTSLYQLIYTNDYYNKISKGQFREIADYVIKENTDKDPVYSNLTWHLIYLFDRDKTNTPLVNRVFEDYVHEMMKDPKGIHSFWYFGAFGNPLKLSPQSDKFMAEHFDVVHSLDKFDSWTRHYVPKEALNMGELSKETFELSNINDINWKGGVGTHDSRLLVNLSEKNIEILKTGVGLRAKNGKVYKILKTEIIGNFIYVNVDKSPKANRDLLEYPNPIWYIK
ncbi:MAG: glycosyltransferase family 39 protein [Flavobacterium sp.]|uniref:glycosyltransferase family 39 protein n=1 Tax=Flavobacterium sp. TaxID=239 RepID=UPI0032678AEF